MSSFLTFIASPAAQQVTKKPIFGKPYMTIAGLFHVVGSMVYQEGGVLGYCLRDAPSLLAKLAAPPDITTINEEEIIREIKESSSIVASELKEVEDEEKTFFYLYTLRELRGIGIDFFQCPTDERLKQKADAEFAGDVMRISFVRGIDFGFNFPEQFATYWENTYRVMPDREWQELYKLRVVTSKKQFNPTLKEFTAATCELAIMWNEGQSPEMLSPNDVSVLQGIIQASREL